MLYSSSIQNFVNLWKRKYKSNMNTIFFLTQQTVKLIVLNSYFCYSIFDVIFYYNSVIINRYFFKFWSVSSKGVILLHKIFHHECNVSCKTIDSLHCKFVLTFLVSIVESVVYFL